MTLRSRFQTGFRIEPVLPGDKSITHRATILGALSGGETVIEEPNPGMDCQATLAAVEALGCRVVRAERQVRITGTSGRFAPPDRALDLGNSGTGLRLLLGALAAQPFPITLTGDDSLRQRPVERVLAPLRSMGVRATASRDRPPVTLEGAPLHGIRHTMNVPSAQVKSALLLAGLQAEGETWIGNTAGTRDHTERLLPQFGVEVLTGPGWVSLRGPQELRAAAIRVPGDLSAASFYLVAAAIRPGSQVTLEHVGLNPTRTKLLQVLERMGVDLEIETAPGRAPEPSGSIRATAGHLEAVDIPTEDIPQLIDELPALAVAAAFARGRTTLRGAAELRVKESNRLEAMAEGLTALGARITLLHDGWTIDGTDGEPLNGGAARSRGDHRIAMSLLVAGLGARKGCELLDEPLIETSDPYFPQNLSRIQGHA